MPTTVADLQVSERDSARQFVQVLVDCPGIEGLLTYAIPHGMNVALGDILTVPLGQRYAGAIALDFVEASVVETFEAEIKPVYALVSTGLFPSRYWELLTRTANYYRTPLMQTVKAALPPKLMDNSGYRIRIDREEKEPIANLSPAASAVWSLLQGQTDRKKGISRRYVFQKLPKYASAGLRELQQLGCAIAYLEPPHRPQPKYEDIVVLLDTTDIQTTSRQKEILAVLQRLGGECTRSQLIEQARTTHSAIQNLAAKGCIAIERRECLRLGGKNHFVAADRPKQLTPDQHKALEAIQSLLELARGERQETNCPIPLAPHPIPRTLLLHGVTGSGKTEVYLQAIASVLAQEKSALVLVPEIGLTPQLTDRFRARFGDAKVNVYHSQLSEGERFDTWRQMLSGLPQIAIGTRSAVFAPLPNLGLIILDEEHDASFKQDQPQPCYHARTIALWRSQLENCPLVLGSATPSTEMLYAVSEFKIKTPESNSDPAPRAPNLQAQYITLPERIGNKPMPPVTVVDMRQELILGNRSIFSQPLQAAIAHMLEQQKQGILFIHRRGHSTFVSCRSCGYVMNCPHCDVSLAYHNPSEAGEREVSPPVSLKAGHLLCHYCNYSQVKPPRCPSCGSPYFKHFGSGTQKVEQEIASLFPGIRLIRFDSDTTRNKDQHRLLLEQFQAGEADLLVGTQMLTKGIDIPQVTLVGVVSADGLLNFSDYRASERAFQTLTQVGGRAGRGEDRGEVVIQTYTPEHPTIQAVQNYDFDRFMRTELSHRQGLNYPPIGQIALIHLSSPDAIALETTANELAEYLRSREIAWEVLGPAPATIARVKNRYRWQILLKFASELLCYLPSLEALRSLVRAKTVRVAIDVDPLTIL